MLLISLCSLVSIFIAVYFPLKMEEEYMLTLIDKVNTISEITSSSVGAGLYFNDSDAINKEMKHIEKIGEIKKIVISNNNSEILINHNPDGLNYQVSNLESNSSISPDRKYILAFTKISFNNINVGYLQIIYDLKPLYDKVSRIQKDIILVSTVIFILNVILAYMLSIYITNPLKKIVKIVKKVSSGFLDAHSDVKSNDEMGVLAKSINMMIDQLRNYYNNLEELVNKRTDELKRANELLNQEMIVRKKAEKILSKNQERLLDAETIAKMTNWEWDSKEDIIEWSPMVKSVLEYDEINLPTNINEFSEFIINDQRKEFLEFLNNKYDQCAKAEKEFNLVTNSGKNKIVNIIIKRNTSDLNKLFGVIQDVTIFKETENQLIESLEQKKTLLKEVHHRVKNNLQIIGSLMFLQSNQIEDKSSKIIFNEGRDRIKSIALIHETLYATDDIGKINMYKYSNNLSSYLKQSYKEGDKITFINNCDSLLIPADVAVPCGLIINELVTNAIKHAFNDSTTGSINLDFKKDNGNYQLIVRDNGIGFSDEFKIGESNSLGMQLVCNLARQLTGEIKLVNADGAKVEIVFPICQE